MPTSPLQPTLWRTCRVLASETRLALLQELAVKEPQTVSELAAQTAISLPIASQALRALEARGVLRVQRQGRFVKYRFSAAEGKLPLPGVLRTVLRQDSDAAATVFRLATAFTHPRRIEVYRLLHAGTLELAALRLKTRMSLRALLRHLQKLEARGFVTRQAGQYEIAHPTAPLARRLAEMAVES